jgi:SAM-dependent methyltransferase
MDNGWEQSAAAWIADMGETGDFSRRYVLDPVMLERALSRSPRTALDVGCGEGRFCRMLSEHGIETTGLDPTAGLIEAARRRDPGAGHYVRAAAEQIPFAEASFDLVVSYLSLIDIADIRGALPEMARVLRPAGSLLIANLTSFATAGTEIGWVKDAEGRRIYYPIDRYLEERAMWIDYRGIRVRNYHRPMRAYFEALLGAGLRLEWFDEPLPVAGAPADKADGFVRAPWFLAMEWSKPTRGAVE